MKQFLKNKKMKKYHNALNPDQSDHKENQEPNFPIKESPQEKLNAIVEDTEETSVGMSFPRRPQFRLNEIHKRRFF